MRLECEFRGWVEEGRRTIDCLDRAMEPEKCKLSSFTTSAMFLAGDELTQSWTSFLLSTELLSVKNSLILPVPHPSADDFVINSISSRAAANTYCDYPPQAAQFPSLAIFFCFSISRRCLAMRSFASCCFARFCFLSLDSSKPHWHWLDLFVNLI